MGSNRQAKIFCVTYLFCLIILCTGSLGALYFLSQDYLIWLAKKENAAQEIKETMQRGEKEYTKLLNDIKLVKQTFAEEQTELQNRKQQLLLELSETEKLKQKLLEEVSERQVYLSSTEEARQQLAQLEQQIKTSRDILEQLKGNQSFLQAEVAKLSGQKKLFVTQTGELDRVVNS